jgi:hypothetical protein
MNVEFSQKIFEKFSNIKFHENQSSGSRVVASIAAFLNLANAPKNILSTRVSDVLIHGSVNTE